MKGKSLEELKKKLVGLSIEELKHRLLLVEADIKNLEDELRQREDLLKFIDDLIKRKRRKMSAR